MVVEKSADERWPRLDKGIMLLVLAAVVVVTVPFPVPTLVPVPVVVVPVLGTEIDVRGVKFTGTLRPADAIAAVSCRVYIVLASITMMSTTTSLLGLSRSCRIFSASATWSALPLAMMAFCAL